MESIVTRQNLILSAIPFRVPLFVWGREEGVDWRFGCDDKLGNVR